MGASRGRLATTAALLVAGFVLCGPATADAAIIWNSAERYVEFGLEQTPTAAGVQEGYLPSYAPKVTASGFGHFSAALGGIYPDKGAWQSSSIGAGQIDVTGYASQFGTDFSSGYYHYLGKGMSRFVVKFSVDEPTPFTLTVNPTSAPFYPPLLASAAQGIKYYGLTGGNTTVHTGTLAPGNWTFDASTWGFGTPYGVDAHLLLAPEPAASTLTLALAGGALLTRRPRTRGRATC